eukprot:IDg13717t1
MASMPPSISALPGSHTKEKQPVRQAVDANSTVVVVGASRGLGLEFVRQAVTRGARVFATYRGASPSRELSALKDVSCIALDVADEASARAAADAVSRAAGSSGVTHVIHNAGIIGDGARLGDVAVSDMLAVFRVNAIGVLNVAQAFAGTLAKREGMRAPVLAILTSKVGSVDDNGSGGMYAYRASKSACNVIAKSLSIDLAPQVAVVLLHPGYVRTGMTGFNGLIDAEESVAGMMRAIEATDASVGFRWVDYK